MKTPGQIAYEGYWNSSHGKSLISGDALPKWEDQLPDIRECWEDAANAVLMGVDV